MKIATNIFDSPENTGPGNFARRLASQLSARGVQFVDSSLVNESNIYYCSAFFNRTIMHAAKHNHVPCVIRIDGLGAGPDYGRVKEAYINADIVIFQSEFSKRLFESTHNFVHPNVFVIHNGIELPQNINLIPHNAKFLSVCNTWNETRWCNFREAVAKHLPAIVSKYPGFKWVIAGKADLPRSEINNPAVEFVNYPADLDKLRRDAIGCIHLVQHDSCPNSLIESMSYGLPSIVWKDSAGPELIGYDKAGIVLNDFSEESIIKAIDLLSRKWTEFNRNALELVEKQWNIVATAQKYLEVFQKSCSV